MVKRVIIAVVVVYLAGFVVFVTSLPKTPRDLSPVEGIVALTGGGTRLDVAVALFEKGVGQRLLISGVHAQTTKTEIKTLTRGGARFDCCADLGYAAEDTRGNAREASAWARFHHFRRLLIVTARYHMPRSLSEFHAAMPDAVIIPYPVDPESIRMDGWWYSVRALRVLHGEYAKFLAVSVLTVTGLEHNEPDQSPRRDAPRPAT